MPILSRKMRPRLQKQTQFLFCRTSRAVLYSHLGGDKDLFCHRSPSICVRDSRGRLAGSLALHHSDDKELFGEGSPQSRALDLVAVIRGYKRFLHGWVFPKLSNREGAGRGQNSHNDRSELRSAEAAERADMKDQSSGLDEELLVAEQSTTRMEQRAWEKMLRGKYVDCVFVL